jgi:FdhE protein
MMVETAFSTEDISRAAKALKRLRPAYQALLPFYEKVFIAQENSKGAVDLEAPQISPQMLAAKQQEALPLADISEFRVDVAAGADLMKQLFDITRADHPAMAESATEIEAALAAGTLSQETLFNRFLAADEGFFEDTARRSQIDKNLLAFLTYHSLIPSLALYAEQLSHYLADPVQWLKGYCPVCGSRPGLAVIDREGRRFLHCSFCRQSWPTPRLFCPFCENDEAKSLLYLFSEQEKDLRADTCDRCKKYIKTVDSREAERIVYPPLEQVASLHLDINAQQQGYASGIEIALNI